MPIERGGYGNYLFGSGDFGTSGSVKDGAASVTATSGMTVSGGRLLESDATVTATSGFTSTAAYRIRLSDAVVSSTSVVVAAGEGVVIKRTDKLQYGGGAYGYNVYDQADLQTISSATSVTTVANGIRIQKSGGTVTATSGASASAEQIYQGSATVTESSSSSASAVYTIKVAVSLTAASSTSISYIRRRHASGVLSETSAAAAIGREKWEIINNNANTWTTISETTTTWSEVA
jgi:hypothetical protein